MLRQTSFAGPDVTSAAKLGRIHGAGSYERTLQTSAGEVGLKVPKLRHQTFETAIIERYRRRESSVEEALIEIYLAGISVRRVEDITEAPNSFMPLPRSSVQRLSKPKTCLSSMPPAGIVKRGRSFRLFGISGFNESLVLVAPPKRLRVPKSRRSRVVSILLG